MTIEATVHLRYPSDGWVSMQVTYRLTETTSGFWEPATGRTEDQILDSALDAAIAAGGPKPVGARLVSDDGEDLGSVWLDVLR